MNKEQSCKMFQFSDRTVCSYMFKLCHIEIASISWKFQQFLWKIKFQTANPGEHLDWQSQMKNIFTHTLCWHPSPKFLGQFQMMIVGKWKSNFYVIYQTRETVFHQDIQTTKRELKIRSGVLLTRFEVFGWPVKHCLECLIYLLKRNKNQGLKIYVKSSKSMLIKIGYPNLLQGCDFLYFNLKNYWWFWYIVSFSNCLPEFLDFSCKI